VSGIKTPILLDIPSELRGERVVLRVPRAGDGAIVYPSVRESLAELKRWMIWATDEYSEQGAEEWCREAAANFLARTKLQFLIFSLADGWHLGNVGAFDFKWDVPSCEIGYWLHSGHIGKGYMTEAVGILAKMLRETLGMARMHIKSDARNLKSRRVAELAGFQLAGVLRKDSVAVGGGLRDSCIYSSISSTND
jgi:ribosomal-protein-serine acetyltransferase